MSELQRYLRLLKLLSTPDGGKDVSEEDLIFFAKYQPDKTSAEYKKELEAAGLKGEDARKAFEGAILIDPAIKKTYIDAAIKQQKGEKAKQTRKAIDTALAGADVISSIQQIKEANRATRRSRRPSRPAPLTADPLLNQAINEAQQGDFTTARRLAPAQLEILNQYVGDINTAKTASTGQAGTYGALGQVASSRRGRGALGLGALAAQIGQQQDARKDQLLGMKLNQNQAIQQSQAQFYPQDLYQYGLDQTTAANLGAMGRTNLRGALTNLGQPAPDIVASRWANQRLNRIMANMSAYGKGPTDAAIAAEEQLTGLKPEQAYSNPWWENKTPY